MKFLWPIVHLQIFILPSPHSISSTMVLLLQITANKSDVRNTTFILHISTESRIYASIYTSPVELTPLLSYPICLSSIVPISSVFMVFLGMQYFTGQQTIYRLRAEVWACFPKTTSRYYKRMFKHHAVKLMQIQVKIASRSQLNLGFLQILTCDLASNDQLCLSTSMVP